MPHPAWVVAWESEALDDAGEPIRNEDREVPDRDSDHRPDEDAHACPGTARSRAQMIVGRARAMPRAWRCPRPGGMGPGLHPDAQTTAEHQPDGPARV